MINLVEEIITTAANSMTVEKQHSNVITCYQDAKQELKYNQNIGVIRKAWWLRVREV